MCSTSENRYRIFENVEEKLNFAEELIENVFSGTGSKKEIEYILSLLFDSNLEKSVSLFIERNFLKKIDSNKQVETAVNLAVISFIEERVSMPNFRFLYFLSRFFNRWQYFKAIFESKSFAEQFSQYMYDALHTAVTNCDDVELKKSVVKSLYTFLFKVYPEISKDKCEAMLPFVMTLLVNDLSKTDYEIKTLCGIILVEINTKSHGKENDFDEDMILKLINPGDDVNFNLIEQMDYSLYLWNGALSINSIKNTILNSKKLMKQCLCYMTSLADNEYLNAELCLKISRTLLTITKKMIGNIEQDKFEADDLNLTGILKFVWSTTENYYVLVKHVSTDILTNVIKLINVIADKCDFLENLISTVFTFSKFQAKKYSALLKIYSYIEVQSAKLVLNRHLNNIVENILNLGVIPVCMQISIKTCLVAILTYDLSEKDEEDWFAYWIQRFILILKNQWFWMIEDLIGRAMHLKPNLITYIGRITNKLNDELHLILLKCVSCLKHGDYSKYIENDVLLASLIQQKSNIKLLALKIVVDKKKKSEVYSAMDLYYVLEFLRFNSKIQMSQDYDAVLSNIVKFFDAFQISYNAIIRDQVDFQRIRYENFIKVLYHFCINQLQYAEELTKLKLTLEILNRLISSYNHIFLITKNDVSNIYQKIFVTYESVKKLVVIILVWLIQNGKTTLMELDVTNERVESLIDSLKINDVTTAVYHLHIMIECAPKSEPERLSYLQHILNMLLNKLRNRLNANVFLPFYGCLYSIRYVLEKTKIFSAELLKYVLNTCCTVFIKTEEFVFNESPEGAIYNFNVDTAIIENDDLNWIRDIFNPNNSHLVTQLILLNSWRCVKDMCLIFAYFCEEIFNRDLVCNYAYQITTMTYILLKLLRGAKHRAILEQSAECFHRVCYVLWRSSVGSLQKLPRMFLSENISLLLQENNSLEISRRSAGIPYLFKSILMSEQVNFPSDVFKETMTQLLEIPSQTCTPVCNKIHVFNILTCLFQDKKFTKIISEFIEPAVILIIHVIEVSSYDLLKPSIISLYSALLKKIFGVNKKKSQSDENIFNITNSEYFGKLSSDEIQLKFPNLLQFIESSLKDYVDNGEGPSPLIFMLLSFLSHVYQTKSNHDSYELTKIVRHLSKIKTLFLHDAVTLIIAKIVTVDQGLELIKSSLKHIHKYPKVSNRRMHFNLYLLKNIMIVKELQITAIEYTQIYNKLLDSSGVFNMRYSRPFFDITLSSMKEHNNPVNRYHFEIDNIQEAQLKKKAILIKMLHSTSFCDVFYRSHLDILYIDMLLVALTFKDVQLFNGSYSIFDHINALNINIDNLTVTVFQKIYSSPVFHDCIQLHRCAIINQTVLSVNDNEVTKIKKLLLYCYVSNTISEIVNIDMLTFILNQVTNSTKKNKYLVTVCLMQYLERFHQSGHPQFDDFLFAKTLRNVINCDDDSLKILCALMISNPKLKWIFNRYNNSLRKNAEIRSLILIIVLLLVEENPVIRNITTRALKNLNIDANRIFETISSQYAIKLVFEYVQIQDDNLEIFRYLINELKIMQQKNKQFIDKAEIYNPTVHNNYIELPILIRLLEMYYQSELSPDNPLNDIDPFYRFI